jgi:hypothetical protein
MENSKNKILNGKDEGIRFICKKHWWISQSKPCKKCCEDLGIPESDYRKAIRNTRQVYFKKPKSDSETPEDLFDLMDRTKLF